MKKRQEKVNSLLEREISKLLVRGRLEGVSGLLTITRVEVSADLRQAKVFFSILGQNAEEVAEVLKDHVYEIQGELNRKLVMKRLPRLVFVPDHSGEYADHISKLIHELHHDDHKQN